MITGLPSHRQPRRQVKDTQVVEQAERGDRSVEAEARGRGGSGRHPELRQEVATHGPRL
jgi:hypothetical protein